MTSHRALVLSEVVVVLLLAGSAVAQVHSQAASEWEGGRAVHDVLALGFTLPLLARRRQPVAVFVLVLAATWIQYELGGGLGQPFFAVLVALYSVGAHTGRPATWLGPLSVVTLAVGVDLPRLRDGAPADEVVPAWFVLLGVWTLGWWVRRRRREAVALTQRAATAEREAEVRAIAAVADERARIARELHDLVSHNIGVVVLQAQGAQRALDDDPERTRGALESIERAGREGLGEMRRLLGLLTGPADGTPDGPQPTLRRLDELVAQVRATGTPVDLEIRGAARELAAGLELTAYRVVQEALTNALKHAPGAPVRVVVDYAAEGVRLSVEDDGTSAGPADVDSGGRGLLGIQERVALYGGELVTGPRPAGGFAVSALLPLEGAQ
jgi:signal transduction histidine kinase